jgi:dTDP-4-amino-4,6-dideoxygalactose transaminase
MPVHLYGQPADMDPILGLARDRGIRVLEDAAQAHGAVRDGRHAGAAGEIGCFSFYPGKNLGAFGDAGAAVTNDPQLAERLRLLRNHGRRSRHEHELIGFNSRMDPLQAAVLNVKLVHLNRWNERRRQAAVWYRELLPEHVLDWSAEDPRSEVHHVFPIISDDRDALRRRLSDAGVQTGIHYPQTVPGTPAFAALGGSFPRAEQRARRQLSLPMHPHLERADAELIASVVGSFVMAEIV